MQEQLTHVSPIDVNRNCTVATVLNVTNATRNPDLYVIIYNNNLYRSRFINALLCVTVNDTFNERNNVGSIVVLHTS